MDTTLLFERFWKRYSTENPGAKRIYDLFTAMGNKVVHDHIALRTFDDPRMNIDVISRLFTERGYEQRGNYEFKTKKLRGIHMEHRTDPLAPKVFISELLTSELSDYLQATVRECLNRPGDSVYSDPDLVYRGSIWGKISFDTYNRLRQESEYAAWLLVYGYRANHFAVKVNELKNFMTLQEVNEFIQSNGYRMTTVGGEIIYGAPEELLEQSATLAELLPVEFTDGIHEIPSCFYEFTLRYNRPDGTQYSGFIAANADKIFESTNYYNKQAEMK
jgi:hypothetical protein